MRRGKLLVTAAVLLLAIVYPAVSVALWLSGAVRVEEYVADGPPYHRLYYFFGRCVAETLYDDTGHEKTFGFWQVQLLLPWAAGLVGPSLAAILYALYMAAEMAVKTVAEDEREKGGER